MKGDQKGDDFAVRPGEFSVSYSFYIHPLTDNAISDSNSLQKSSTCTKVSIILSLSNKGLSFMYVTED